MAFESITNTASTYKEVPTQRNKVEVIRTELDMPNNPISVTTDSANDNYEEGKDKQDRKPSEQTIASAVSRANSKIKYTNTRCEYTYHEETKRVSITVFNKDTEEIIRQIPPEESLEMLEKMWELAGLVVDEKR